MNQIAATLMSIAMLAAFALVGFGAKFAFKAEHRKHGLLMVVAGLVLVVNVLLWAV